MLSLGWFTTRCGSRGWARGLLVVCAIASGCSDAAVSDAATGGEGDTSGGPSTAPMDEESGDDALDDSGGDAPMEPSGDTGDDGLGEACELDCGEGTCAIEDGLPACACAAGSVAVGLTCLSCTATGGAADLEITPVAFSTRVLVDSMPAPSNDYEDGLLWLRDHLRGDEILLGNSHEPMLTAAALPGTYDVIWERQSGGAVVPRNTAASLGRVQVRPGGLFLPDDTESGALDVSGSVLEVNVPTIAIFGDFSFNQVPAPDSAYDNGRVYLLDPATGDEVTLGQTRDGDYAVRVIAGTYEVHFESVISNGLAPVNHDAYITTITVQNQELAYQPIDIPITTLEGRFLIDGVSAPSSPYDQGKVVLRDVATGDEIEVGYTSSGDFEIPVVPGTYELVYTHVIGDGVAPKNSAAILELLQVPANGVLQHDVDVLTTTVAGLITIGGATPPTDPGNVGLLSLRATDNDDEVPLGLTTAGQYSARVVQGTYEVFYSQQTSTGALPLNTNARLGAAPQLVPGEVLGDIDVPVVPVEGTVTFDGAAPPTSEYDDGRIYLRDVATDDSVLLGSTRTGTIAGLVVPGTYEVVYAVETAGGIVPRNSGAAIETVVLPEGKQHDVSLDIPVGTLAGAVTVGGAAPPLGDADRADLVLQDTATDDFIFLGPVSAGAFAVPLVAGTYVVWYEAIESTGVLPGNVHAGLACFALQP